MKSFKVSFFAIVLIFLMASSVFAYYEYEISELGVALDIPEKYSVITRDTPSDDPAFDLLGMTHLELIEFYKSNNIYLSAFSDSFLEEIIVTMQPNDFGDYASFSDIVLGVIADTIVEQYDEFGVIALDYEIYQHSQTKFIKLYFTDTDNTVYGLQYSTVHDGKVMYYTMRSYVGEITSEQESTFRAIIDSIRFDKDAVIEEPAEETGPFLHTDPDSYTRFTVPANWVQENFFEDREFIDVKFTSIKEKGYSIIYGSIDAWSELSEDEKNGYSRADIDNSIITKEEVAQICSTTPDKVSIVEYNGYEYYMAEMNSSYDVSLPITITCLLRIQNGWMNFFQFSGTEDDKLFSDFESLLNSAEYLKMGTFSSSENVDNDNEDKKQPQTAVGGVVIFIIMAIVLLVAFLSSEKIQKKTDLPSDDLTVKFDSKFTFCKKCGQKLSLDDDYCHICGAKIDKGGSL